MAEPDPRGPAEGAKIAVINGRLGEKSFRGYQRIGWFVARLLRQIDLFAVQDETYAERFRLLGTPPAAVHVTGSMKYDGAETDRTNPKTERLRTLAGIGGDDAVFLAGSTQEPEEAIAMDIFKRLSGEFPRLRLIIVPRHAERFGEVARLLDQSGLAWQRRTELESEAMGAAGILPVVTGGTGNMPVAPQEQKRQDAASTARILLVDVVGELGGVVGAVPRWRSWAGASATAAGRT